MSSVSEIVHSHLPNLSPYESLYKHFHAHPELSHHERETAAKVHGKLSELSAYSIHPNIGGHGLAAVLSNGPGATVLLRADMDALPVLERTGLEYASKVVARDDGGEEHPVMHACGHDMHITALLAAAELLAKARDSWSGTLVLCFQPAEEKGEGARRMVDDGLYDKVPVPDVCVGAHVLPYRAGTIGTRRGLMACAADSFQLTLHGRSGHASMPDKTIDPIVLAASTILRLQTIVSREVAPADHAVVTVSAIRAGHAENAIPDTAELKLNVRTMDPDVRKRVLSAIHRIVDAEARASGIPAAQGVPMPELAPLSNFPFTVNDETATSTVERAFAAHFPAFPHGYDPYTPRLPGSEDFGVLASSIEKPSVFFTYGCVDPEVWDKAEREGKIAEDVPVNHSSFFAPAVMPTLKVAAEGYAVAALAWLAKAKGKEDKEDKE